MGRTRSIVMTVTRSAEPVCWYTKTPTASISIQRTPNWTAPISHSRQKSGSVGQRRDRAGSECVNSLAPGARVCGALVHVPRK